MDKRIFLMVFGMSFSAWGQNPNGPGLDVTEDREPIVIQVEGGSAETQVIELPDGQGQISITLNSVGGDEASDAVPDEDQVWMGAGVEPVAPAIAEYLELPVGEGIQIGEILPGSPAENAGLKINDIIIALDDQHIMNPEQFVKLVRRHAAGQKVILKVLRKGQALSMEVVLSSRKFAPAEPVAVPERVLPPARMPFRSRPVPDAVLPPDRGTVQREMRSHSSRSSTMQNDQGTFSLTENDGQKYFTIKDPAGQIVFDGPVNTEDEREAVPKAYQGMLHQMEKGDFHVFPGLRKSKRQQMAPGVTF